MDIKLLALDMDGTVLRDDSVSVSLRTQDAIRAAISKGVVVVYCTGRMRNRLPEQLTDHLPGMRYAVTSNGGAVVDLHTGAVLYSNGLRREKAAALATKLAAYTVPIDIYCDGNNYCDRRTLALVQDLPFSESRKQSIMRNRFVVEDLSAFLSETDMLIEKFNLIYLPEEQRPSLMQMLKQTPDIRITSSFQDNAEINAATASKGDGLAHLCQYLEISPDQVMSIGDNGNDMEMLRFSGLSVAMGNATDEIKALADRCTASNEADGVALAIEQYLL